MTASLLSRLQSLTEPDREIDAEIALATFPWLKDCPRDDRDGDPGWITKDGRTYAPHYTESLDAALTLLPPDFGFKIETDDWKARKESEHLSDTTFASVHDIKRHRGCIGEPDDKKKHTGIYALTHFNARAATPAIALLIAIMKAQEESKP